jgi:hypothetical protein
VDFVWILFEYGQRRRIGREIAPIDYQPLGKVEPNERLSQRLRQSLKVETKVETKLKG